MIKTQAIDRRFRILAIGDVVGQEAVKYLSSSLWAFRRENKINFTVCNAENAALGNGLDPQTADKLISSGCDILTGGNHIFKKNEIRSYIENSETLIRPANYPPDTPGNGYNIINIDGFRILVINILGVIYLESLACPFMTVERILEREKGQYDFSVMDIHAEATSEKLALARYFDGKISCIFGTHTHIQTADEQVLPNKSGYITDLGMTGPCDSILGIRSDIIIEKLRTKLPVRFEVACGKIECNGAVFELDEHGKCCSVSRVRF